MSSLILILLFIFISNNSIAANRCINYLAGVGRMEVSSYNILWDKPNTTEDIIFRGRDYKSNFILPSGWWFTGINENSDVKIYIDREIHSGGSENNGSLYFETNKVVGRPQFYIGRVAIWLAEDRISSETRNYYPRYGDELKVRLKYRLDQLQNATINLRLVSEWNIIGTNDRHWFTFGSKILNLSPNNFSSFEATATLPYPHQVTTTPISISAVLIDFHIIFASADDSDKKIKLWVDDIELFTFRNRNCLTLPEQRRSFLKFFEVFGHVPEWGKVANADFVKLYKENVLLSNSYNDIFLINKELNPNFRYTFYLSPSTFHRYRKYNTSSLLDKFRAPENLSEVLNFFDDIQIPTTTDTPSDHGNHISYRIHHNSHYPEYLLIRNNALNLYDYPYRLTRYMISITNHIPLVQDLFQNYFFKLDTTLFYKSNLSPDFYFIDNFNHGGGTDHSPKFKPNKLYFYKNSYQFLSPLRKYFMNVGYGNLSTWINNPERKFGVSGFMNEGWIYNPEYFNYAENSSTVFNWLVSSVIENKDLNIIMLIGAYPYYNNPANANRPDRNCTDTEPVIRSLVSLFYLVNNHNVYYALVPGGRDREGYVGNKYYVPQCYTQSMFINLGQYSNVNNINQMIIATNSDNWYLYERRYERGLVVFNSSPNFSYSYRINWQNLPYQTYREYFTNTVYSSNTSNLIIIPPKSGIILYYDE